MKAVCEVRFEEGILKAEIGSGEAWVFDTPAKLAQARLKIAPPLKELICETGEDLLAAAYSIIPFLKEPFPKVTFGAAITPAARAAFNLFMGVGEYATADAFHVLRGEVDDFVMCARRYQAVWKVAAFTREDTTLTFRFEDLRALTPPDLRALDYTVEVMRDSHPGEEGDIKHESLVGIAFDARIALDLSAGGGFCLTLNENL